MPDGRACNRSKIPHKSGMACHSAEFSHGLGRKPKFKLGHYRRYLPLDLGDRRRNQAREREALAAAAAQRQAMFDPAEAFAAALARDLERCAAIQAVMAPELEAAYAPC